MNLLMRSGQGASTVSRTGPSHSGGLESAASFGTAKEALQSRAWSDCINELLDIRNFDDDWDGGGTERLDPTLVDSAINLALGFKGLGMPPADRVIAGVNRTLCFEWRSPQGFQELEISSPTDAEFRWIAKGSTEPQIIVLNPHRS